MVSIRGLNLGVIVTMSSKAPTPIKMCWRVLVFLSLLFLGVSSKALTRVPTNNIPNGLIYAGFRMFELHSPTHNSYEYGNLISAYKLVEPAYVTWRLVFNLTVKDSPVGYSHESCTIDLRRDEWGFISVDTNLMECMYLSPPSSEHKIKRHVQRNFPEKTEIVQDEAVTTERVLQLDHEVETVAKNGNERTFISIRRTDQNYCAGCPYELNPTLPGLAAFGEQVVQEMDDSGDSNFKHKVVSIVRVTSAVPPGSNVVKYELNLEIGETNCPRSAMIDGSECILLPNRPIKSCLVTFEEPPWKEKNRKITGNNCTDLSDNEKELNGNYEGNYNATATDSQRVIRNFFPTAQSGIA